VVHQPKDFAVIAESVQVAGISGDLDDIPYHVFSGLLGF
jgi:hypothetical protein